MNKRDRMDHKKQLGAQNPVEQRKRQVCLMVSNNAGQYAIAIKAVDIKQEFPMFASPIEGNLLIAVAAVSADFAKQISGFIAMLLGTLLSVIRFTLERKSSI